MTAPDVFERIVRSLESLEVPYMLTGSLASSYHAVPRATQDVDLVIAPTRQQLQQLVKALPVSEYYADETAALEAYDTESLFNVIDLATGWKIDFIIRKSRPFSRLEFERRRRVDFEGSQLFIATAEVVVLSKLEWAKLGASQRQIEDAAAILRIRADEIDLTYIEKWVVELQLQTEWNAARQRAGVGPG